MASFRKHSRLLVSLSVASFFMITFLVHASGLDAGIVPNTSIEAGASSVTFNVTINNTNSTLNMTSVNMTLPSGFSFVAGSNSTSAAACTFQSMQYLEWQNQTQKGFVMNLTEEWFAFNSSVNSTPGEYNLTLVVRYTDGSANSTMLPLTVNDTTPPSDIIVLPPSPLNNSWTNQSWFIVNISFSEMNTYNCLLDLNNGTPQNWTMSMSGQTCWFNASGQPQGSHNWSVWVNDTSGNAAQNHTWRINIGPVPHDLEPAGQTPPNGSVVNTGWFISNFTFAEDSPDTCLLFLDNGTVNVLNMTINSTCSFCYVNVTGQGEGHLNYTFWINNTQGAWNQSQEYHLALDLTPTLITNISVAAGYDCARVEWETPFPADSMVLYGTGNDTNLTSNVTNTTLDVNHSMNVSGLDMGTEYFYNITSCDNMSVCNTSGPWNFTTMCIENWNYGSWSGCINGQQTRSATDLNNCGTTDNRSATSQECDDGGGGGGGGGGESQPTIKKVFSAITPAMPASMDISISGIAATYLAMEVSDKVGTSNIIVKGFSSVPYRLEPPEGRVHSYLNITTSANSSRVSRIIIEFSVEREWVDGNDIDVSTIRLMRLNQSWEELTTILLSSRNDSLSFKSLSPGLSWFAIAGDQAGSANITEEPAGDRDTAEEIPDTHEQAESDDATVNETWDLCVPGERQCLMGMFLQECNAWGTGWVNTEQCFYGCRDGECSDTLTIEIDYDTLWLILLLIAVLSAIFLIYIKRRAIDDFVFWRL
jgi:PGF-pre-PGF domain-containing protein